MVRAADLYCGSAWVPARELIESHAGRVRVWIVSAGQGLLTPETMICPYAATFSAGHLDSVISACNGTHSTADWWRLLCEWRQKISRSACCSVAGIAKRFPKESIIAALSSDYLDAVHDDLILARGALCNPDRLVIVSSGSAKDGVLRESFLPCDSRMEHVVGRGRSALNVRILQAVVSQAHPDRICMAELRTRYERKISRLPHAGYPKRVRSTDDEVRRFIRAALKTGLPTSHSRLLKAFRKSGLACEQSRFRGLFQELKTKG